MSALPLPITNTGLRNLIGKTEAAEVEHGLKAVLSECMILNRDFPPLS